jgi:hypothetical protein
VFNSIGLFAAKDGLISELHGWLLLLLPICCPVWPAEPLRSQRFDIKGGSRHRVGRRGSEQSKWSDGTMLFASAFRIAVIP